MVALIVPITNLLLFLSIRNNPRGPRGPYYYNNPTGQGSDHFRQNSQGDWIANKLLFKFFWVFLAMSLTIPIMMPIFLGSGLKQAAIKRKLDRDQFYLEYTGNYESGKKWQPKKVEKDDDFRI